MATKRKIRKPRNHAIRMEREAAENAAARRNLRKEREIGVHPKFLNSYARRLALAPAAWEKLSRDWDKSNPAGA